MKMTKPVAVIIVFFIILLSILTVSQEKSEELKKSENDVKGEKIVVYYFMTTTRCPGCLKIENYTHSCLLEKFSDEMAQGKMEWKMVNIDEKENKHFVEDYQIFTKTVVLSKTIDGKEVKWKRLDKVWEYLNNQKKFYNYIESEIKSFIKEGQ